MSKRFYKYKLLLDENMPPRQRFPRLNEHYDVKHVRDDLHRGGSVGPSVCRLRSAVSLVSICLGCQCGGTPITPRSSAVPTRLRKSLQFSVTRIRPWATASRYTPAYFEGRVRTLGAAEEEKAA